jgi:hypothetical protein
MKIYTIDELSKARIQGARDKQKRKSRGIGVERVAGPPLGDPFPSKNSLGWRSWIGRNKKWIDEHPKWNPPSGTGLLRTGAVKNMPGHYFNKSDLDELAKGRGPDKKKRKRRGAGLQTEEWGSEKQVKDRLMAFKERSASRHSNPDWSRIGLWIGKSNLSEQDELAKGRGPDKQKRKKKEPSVAQQQANIREGRGYGARTEAENLREGRGLQPIKHRRDKKAKDSYLYGERPFAVGEYHKSLTLQDEKNIDLIRAMVDKSPDLQKKLEGPIKWVGDVGWRECVAHLSKKKGITHAESLCGYLKGKARSKGQLKKEHMGSKERKQKK